MIDYKQTKAPKTTITRDINELTEKVNYDTGLRYTYGSDDSVTVRRLSDNSIVQSYTVSSNEAQVSDPEDIVTTVSESHFGTSYTSSTTNAGTTFTGGGSGTASYSFTDDSAGNLATETIKYNNGNAFTTAYSYDSNDNITSKTITLADNTTFNVVNTYDSKSRITSTGYGSAEQTYTYDQYGQLTQTVDTANEFTETYSYDQRGNILTKTKVYDDTSIPSESTTFTYGNSVWPDELTSVNGTSLTYDANGNVLTYGNMEFEWTNGRVLSQITVNPTDPNGTEDVYSYTYDESGIRSSKTVNGVTTYFTTKDGVILSQTDGTNTMYFQYDNSGNPAGFLYNGAQYFYLTNQMGDVIGIADSTGSLIATYTYGAWGEVLAVTPATAGNTTQLAIANTNPLRYRGYYQDQETGYYYLQSRYYDSYVSRFINADNIIISRIIKSETAGTNLFAYCYNSSPSYEDSTGQFTLKIYLAMAIVSAVIAALSQIITNIVKRHYRGRKIFRNVTGYATGMAVNNVILMALIKRPALRKYSNLLAAFSGALVQSFIDCVERRIITGKKTLKGLTFAIIKNTAYGYVGNFLGARFKKTNPGWFQPKTLRSFFSKSYGQKLLQQSGISAAISLALSLLPSKQGGKLATIQRYLR